MGGEVSAAVATSVILMAAHQPLPQHNLSTSDLVGAYLKGVDRSAPCTEPYRRCVFDSISSICLLIRFNQSLR